MSKAAVIHMTRAMALEWGKFGINVNAHLPGLHRHRDQPPPLADRGRPEAGADAAAQARGQARDLDAALMMLCANESHFINGAVILRRTTASASDGV
jgi:NAD(P)-dependent dehydrogenase (short-subunit alcohol dehydrogenase family)